MAKVLVVEDDDVLSTILVKSLIAAQYDVRAVMDGSEAYAEIKDWHPDLVLLDMLMPHEDGLAVLRKIRADADTASTHVIVLSNLSDKDTLQQVQEFGVTEYFIKSQTIPAEILRKLETIFVKASPAT